MATNYLTYSRRKWREAGYYVEGTEQIRRMPGGLVSRKDLFGFCDLLLVPVDPMERESEPWIYLQVTSWSNVSARLKKIKTETTGSGQWRTAIKWLARRVLLHGDRIVIEGWRQSDGPGSTYICKEREVTMEDLR